MSTGLTFGDGTGKPTIGGITTTENTKNDDASDGDYSVENDFTEISLTDTMVDADNNEFTFVEYPQDTNYYAPIQDNDTSSNAQDNEAAQENDENSLHGEARENDGETRPDEISYTSSHNLIPSVETISNDAHLTALEIWAYI